VKRIFWLLSIGIVAGVLGTIMDNLLGITYPSNFALLVHVIFYELIGVTVYVKVIKKDE